MTTLTRRAVLAALLGSVPLATARASGGAKGGGGDGKPAETFVKLPSVALEYWDEQGLFHSVHMELAAVFPAQASINKKLSAEITRVLASMTWEEFSQGNPAATIKAVALDVVRKDPSGKSCIEVLVTKLNIR